jgi:polyisoprenoid-binding protein YceI
MSTTKWAVDPTHSEIGFKVKHMMFTNVSGKFQNFEASVEANEDNNFEDAKFRFSGSIDSISTGNDDRDTHLKSADFFDAEQFPKITFKSVSFAESGYGYELKGDLTLHGITKPVTLEAEFGGLMKDPWGNTKAGFSLTGKINRKDWGLNWNAALETGGVLVSEEVRLSIELQFIKQ